MWQFHRAKKIKESHNKFGRTDAFLHDGKNVSKNAQSDEIYHFVAYVPYTDGNVYELDGLKTGPVNIGSFDLNQDGEKKTKWLSVAREAIQKRMEGDAIKFNLMAVVKDKRIGLKEKIEADPTDGSLVHQLNMEEEKRKQWKIENQRRRYNYVPLCVIILKELARANMLNKLFEDAKARKRQKILEAKK